MSRKIPVTEAIKHWTQALQYSYFPVPKFFWPCSPTFAFALTRPRRAPILVALLLALLADRRPSRHHHVDANSRRSEELENCFQRFEDCFACAPLPLPDSLKVAGREAADLCF